MTTIARCSHKMSWAKGQSSGWAAFDLKQRQKQGLEPEVDKDPFPPISASLDSSHEKSIKNKHVPAKSFSSVLLASKYIPVLKENGSTQPTMLNSDSGDKCRSTIHPKDVKLAIRKLRECHQWAENSLIEDILAAVSNNVDKALILLETMASAANFEEYKQSCIPRPTTLQDIPGDEMTGKSLSIGKVMYDVPVCSTLVGHVKDKDKDLENGNASSDQNLPDGGNLKCNIERLNSVPVEPEWEEDDFYISHRKDALRTMRSASRHSKAASNAFLRGDHFSAQQHSMKAREEWHAAEELNTKAAKEILSIRNSEHDIWRLDLHGLHATEAIQALQEHLHRIESHGFSKGSAASNGVKEKNGLLHSTHDSVNCMDRESLYKQQAPLRLRLSALDVITGIGNHSRGQAALPAAVRSFLNENGYRFEEMRPGVITVWPKFRQS